LHEEGRMVMGSKRGKDYMEGMVKEYRVSDPDYGELIIESVQGIDNQRLLNYIYELINSFKKKWGI